MEPSPHDPRLDSLVNLVYDAALDARLWAGLAPKIARAFDSTSTVLKTQGPGEQVQLVEVTDNLIVAPKDQAWADYWHRNDLWVERTVALGINRIVTGDDLMSEAEFERSGFYQDWNRYLGIYYVVGAAFPIDQNTLGVLGIHRPKGAGRYAEEDRQRVARFLPHLNRALCMRQRLEHVELAQCASLDALDRLDTAVVVVDANCRVLYANRLAEHMLSTDAHVRVCHGRLGVADAKAGTELMRLVREAAFTAKGVLDVPGRALAIPRPQRLPVTVLVAPLRASWDRTGRSPPAAMVFVRDPEQGAPAQSTLRELFALTRTEAAITAALVEGYGLEQIAARFHVGLGTVRSHLKTILSKTGTHRQAQLVALVSRSVASLTSREGQKNA
jgi:DNA-binding CsgD family transcriptional regulator